MDEITTNSNFPTIRPDPLPFRIVSEKSTRNDLDYVFESRAARNRSVFATTNAALVAQNPSGGVPFQGIGAEKGDSRLGTRC
jgi:hypothetical protein